MNSKTIQIGSIVYGTAGIGCKVLAIDGDILTIETPTGEGKISNSRVVRVENKPCLDAHNWEETSQSMRRFEVGDLVDYIGCRFAEQYAGELKIWELGKGGDADKCTCLKPNGRTTSWIEYSDLVFSGAPTNQPPHEGLGAFSEHPQGGIE
jgi:hypothetical protein